MRLSDSGSMREYIKKMSEIFDKLAVVAEPVSDEDKVVYLLAGLPESYDVLVTALESRSDTVPGLETVTERLLREEQKLKDREEVSNGKKLLLSKEKKTFTCHYSKKPGHFKRDCRKFVQNTVWAEAEISCTTTQTRGQTTRRRHANQERTGREIQGRLDCGLGCDEPHV